MSEDWAAAHRACSAHAWARRVPPGAPGCLPVWTEAATVAVGRVGPDGARPPSFPGRTRKMQIARRAPPRWRPRGLRHGCAPEWASWQSWPSWPPPPGPAGRPSASVGRANLDTHGQPSRKGYFPRSYHRAARRCDGKVMRGHRGHRQIAAAIAARTRRSRQSASCGRGGSNISA